MNDKSLINLINDYIACSKYMCSYLKDYYKITTTTLLAARRSLQLIPKEGRLPESIYFNFHGGGCFFEFENGEIDVDFGPNDRCDGFDYYRLKDFLSTTKQSSYKNLLIGTVLKDEYESSIKQGIIYNPQWDPGYDLYYLK